MGGGMNKGAALAFDCYSTVPGQSDLIKINDQPQLLLYVGYHVGGRSSFSSAGGGGGGGHFCGCLWVSQCQGRLGRLPVVGGSGSFSGAIG